MNATENINTMINQFSKSNKVSRQKIESLVKDVLAAAGVREPKKRGMKKDTTTKQGIIRLARNFEVFTLTDISLNMNVSKFIARNALKECIAEGIIAPAGKANNPKGPKETLWGIKA